MAAICSNDAAAYPADSYEKMGAFARQHHLPFPYLHDAAQSVARAYGAACTPDFFGFNSELKLQYRGRLDDSRASPNPAARRRASRRHAAGRRHRAGPARAAARDRLLDQVEGRVTRSKAEPKLRHERPLPADRPERRSAARGSAGARRRPALVRRGGRAPPRRPAAALPAAALPPAVAERLAAPRAPVCGLGLDRPRIMGVLNVTPDSFSDGGAHLGRAAAIARARALAAEGADILDIGGESTRPGADPVPLDEEAARVVPVIAALRAEGFALPISIDTRNAAVARAAFDAGADLFNDVSALRHDPGEPRAGAAASGRPVCLMHAQGDPRTMQDAPAYDDVLLDVFDFLEARVAAAEAAGIPRGRASSSTRGSASARPWRTTSR